MKKQRRLLSEEEMIKNEGMVEVFSREELAVAFECGEWQIRRDLKLIFEDTYKGGKRVFIEDAWLLYLANLKRYILKLISFKKGVQNPRINPDIILDWLESFQGEGKLSLQKDAAIKLGGSWEDFHERLAKGKVMRLSGRTINVECVAA